ncbi:MAG: glycoside hydrolase family 9 protein [Ignavibacteriales bacterium]|nr:glycoside hydrolase family 9 protein [Ignavibacteriales bacterium]
MLRMQWVHFWLASLLGLCGILFFLAQRETQAQTLIAVNQLGYRPQDPKLAFITESFSGPFEVIDVSTNKSVYRGKVRPIGFKDANSGDVTFTLNFSDLAKPGRYQVWLQEASSLSPEFEIKGLVYQEALTTALQSFYFQRCGTDVGERTAWGHPVCHREPAAFFSDQGRVKDVGGGWHDAGDYNKFVPTTAVSIAFLLYAYEHKRESFRDGQLAIPERANGVPDILDEARWALAWLLKMQNDQGGVYHKVSIKKWTGEHLPHTEKDRQFIFDVSSASTADFAAVTALAARLFEPWDRPFAQLLLRSSLRAWEFLQQNPSIVPVGGFKNPAGVEGGEYGDTQDSDERLWASVELYRTTGSNQFHSYFLGNYKLIGAMNAVSWQRVQNFAHTSYLRLPTPSLDLPARGFIIGSLMRYSDNLLLRLEQSGYRFVLASDEYYWGSNSVAMGYAFDLLQASEIIRKSQCLHAAIDQLHYMLGRNPFHRSFVTALGTTPVRRPYHQFSMVASAGRPVPGLLVGGANKYGKLRGKTISEFPAKCYEDNEKNYYVNEVAINYTAPLAYVLAYLCGSESDGLKNQ